MPVHIEGVEQLRLPPTQGYGWLVKGPTQMSTSWTLGSGEVDTVHISMESLILAQNERWQRGLGMQVEREADDQSFERVIRWKVAEG